MSASRQERKIVTALFCDLVGFTSQAEEMDPEDVASVLAPYHARLKEELERFGGTVEKFIGDAVMALFGAPVSHEDDPERAVRAALAIRGFAVEDGLELRIGIATGEALVTLDARPDAGETMATGDVVNTAARLQANAPVNGILVSEKTFQATGESIEFREAEAVAAAHGGAASPRVESPSALAINSTPAPALIPVDVALGDPAAVLSVLDGADLSPINVQPEPIGDGKYRIHLPPGLYAFNAGPGPSVPVRVLGEALNVNL